MNGPTKPQGQFIRAPAPGTRLPGSALMATSGAMVMLATRPGITVVFVYPYTGRPGYPDPPGWDDIPGAHGSTPQAEGFRDAFAAYTARGCTIFGLSSQATDWQREFCERKQLPFDLLSDAQMSFSDALGLPRFTAGDGAYLIRLTMIARNGVIEAVLFPVPDPKASATATLNALDELRL